MKLADLFVPVVIGVGAYYLKNLSNTIRENNKKESSRLKEFNNKSMVEVKFLIEPYSESERKFMKALTKNADKIGNLRVQLAALTGKDRNVYIFEILPENFKILNEFEDIKFV